MIVVVAREVGYVAGGIVLGAGGLALVAWVWVVRNWPRG